mmetsp:Transcript_25184/g.79378  ORF Transcript_25184/g.79378 Transcript_25184/m.79378 type:complete len:202 (-) Transcript_25184:947-1552(-)
MGPPAPAQASENAVGPRRRVLSGVPGEPPWRFSISRAADSMTSTSSPSRSLRTSAPRCTTSPRNAGRSLSSAAKSARQRAAKQTRYGDSSSSNARRVRPAPVACNRAGTWEGYWAAGFGAAPSSTSASRASKSRRRAREPQIPEGQPLPLRPVNVACNTCHRPRRKRYSCHEPVPCTPQSVSQSHCQRTFDLARRAHSGHA